ncbi:hypothetical protein [Vibrio campbellii]|uniref:hypothetical protein n=1 Tax=Vibrio campbellii TaxID=680 RepID=UPI00210C7859|nr:hypothetical protein [Vibrio campbellii]
MMPVTKLFNTLFKDIYQVHQSAPKQVPKLEKSKSELPVTAHSTQSMSEPLSQNPVGLQSAPRIYDEDVAPLAKAFSSILQQYVDNKPGKHGGFLRGYCEMEEIKGRITIDDQEKVRVIRLPRSPQKLAEMFNLMLKGHSRFGSMYEALTRPLENKENILSSYLRLSHDKVKAAKTLPTEAVTKAEQTNKVKLQEINTEAVPKNAQTHVTESLKPDIEFTSRERNMILDDIKQIMSDYLFTGKKAASHQEKIKTLLEGGDPMLSRFLNVVNGEMELRCPKDRQELKGFFDALLEDQRGFGARFSAGSSSLVNLVKKTVQSETGTLGQYLKWDSSNRLATREPSDETIKAAEKAERQKLLILENREKAALTKEIKLCRDKQPALLARVRLARHLQVHARTNWPELEFRSIPVTRMTRAPLHGGESLTQLRNMLQAVNRENRVLAGEIELNLEQLPITSEIREKGLPVTRLPIKQALTELRDKVTKMEKASSNRFTRLIFKPQHQTLNEIRGRLNELDNLHQQLTEYWPGMPNQIWFSSFVAREVERLSDKITPKRNFGLIQLTTPEHKAWQAVKAEMLTK